MLKKLFKTTLAVLPLTFAVVAQAQVFSLDDNPSAPLTGPFAPPFFSAEDPFGFVLPATTAGLIGPSPSLGLGLFDSDALITGPVALPPFFVPENYVDGFSSNQIQAAPQFLRLMFSIDRYTSGQAGTASAIEAGFNQAPGDAYVTTSVFPNPSFFVGTAGVAPYGGVLPSAGVGGSNLLWVDESVLGLLAGGAVIPAGMPAPPIAPGTHDNIDALDAYPTAPLNNYHSIAPADAPVFGFSPADILLFGAVFAPANNLGLDIAGGPNTDDVNALVIFDTQSVGTMDVGVDYALFSLSPGSMTLGVYGLNPATIFFTDFSGKFFVYAYAGDLGLLNGMFENVDALYFQ